MRDYYQDLEVEPAASFEQIKAAYRRKALRHHPDRGGSHAEMVIVNEAWEVLSILKLRRQYDEQRQTGASNQATFEEARQRSRNYERNWRKFDSWLSSISRDFDSAQFSSKKLFGMEMPTASKSISAWVFLISGGLAGFLVWVALFVSTTNAWESQNESSRGIESPYGRLEKRDNNNTHPFYIRMVFLSCVASVTVGAWGGKWTHQNFGAHIAEWLPNEMPFPFFNGEAAAIGAGPKHAGGAASEPNKNLCFTNCPRCEQKLRIPSSKKTRTISCPKCETRFDFPTPINHRKKNRMKLPPNKSALATMLRCLLIFEIAFAVIFVGIEIAVSSAGEQILADAGLSSPEVNMVAMAMSAVAFIVLLPMAIASWVGLFQYKNWGRWLYLISLVFGHLLLVFMGCFSWTYTWDLVSALDSIGYINSGLIVAICFLSPFAAEFEQPKNS